MEPHHPLQGREFIYIVYESKSVMYHLLRIILLWAGSGSCWFLVRINLICFLA